jgi:hypothetical protein
MEVEPWPNNSNGMKNEVLVGTSRKHIENLGEHLGNLMRAHWEQKKKNKKFPCPLFPTSPKKLRKRKRKKEEAC